MEDEKRLGAVAGPWAGTQKKKKPPKYTPEKDAFVSRKNGPDGARSGARNR